MRSKRSVVASLPSDMVDSGFDALVARFQLFNRANTSLQYLTTKTNFKALNPDIPVTFRSETADSVKEFEGSSLHASSSSCSRRV